MGYRLGVDLGTTFTSAAVYTSGWPTMVGLGLHAMQVPSVLFLTPDGEFLIGDSAELRGASEPGRMVREFKRRIGDRVPILVAGSPHSPQALQAHLLRWVVAQVTERQGSGPDHITLTYPASWGLYKQDLLTQTMRMADVTRAGTCTEPEAAATLYAARHVLAEGECIAVYDLGGGTFDAAVMRRTAAGFELLGEPEGLEHLGGIDFDEAVFRHVLEALGDGVGGLPDDLEVTTGLARLRRDCVAAKEALSSDVETTIPVALPGLAPSVTLVREDFEDMVRPAVVETTAALRRAMGSADVGPTDLTAIVLTGGSSRIPLVRRQLDQAFGRPLALDTHPKHDIALGAALHGAASPPRAPTTAAPAAPDAASTSARPDRSAPLGVPPSASSVPPATDGRPPRTGRRRTPYLVGLVVLVVLLVAGAVGVVLVARSGNDQAAQGGDGTAPTTAPTTPGPSSPDPTTTPTGPAAARLPTNALLLTRRTKKGHVSVVRVDAGADPTTHRVFRTTDVPAHSHPWLPTISPDRTTVVYLTGSTADASLEPWVKTLDGPARPLLTPDSPCRQTGRPAFSPTGDQLAVICQDAGTGKASLLTIDLQGNLVDPLVADGTPAGNPTWTSDGRVIFQRDLGSGQPQKLWSVAADGDESAPRRVTSGSGWDSHEDFSNATGRLLFLRTVGAAGGGTVYAGDENGVTFVPVGSLHDVQAPCWSPDGQQIAFLRQVDHHLTLWVMGADGSSPRRLDVGAGKPGAPAWDSR